MYELTKQQYLETMDEKMWRFKLTKQRDIDTVLEIAADMVEEKGMQGSNLELSHCYENGAGTYSHYLVNLDGSEKYIAVIANEVIVEWHGFYFLEMNKEYGKMDKT